MTDQYAVMGYPVGHSKSPKIHTRFAQQTGQDLEYRALEVEPGTFIQQVQQFFDMGGKGLNITVPFKQEAWELAQIRSAQAAIAGAVNTLFMDAEGRLHGHNTDGIGLVRDILQNHAGQLQQSKVLILGAGGAARGILLPLIEQAPSCIYIANRTHSKAVELAELFTGAVPLTACGFAELGDTAFDWVINATSASLGGQLPPVSSGILASHTRCYDLMYGKEPTLFCRWALQNGAAQALDGFGMLVEQAAEAFWLWRGVRPLTAEVLASQR